MSLLIATIDRERARVEFTGPGTYGSREQIKALGNARWDGARKVWVVSEFHLSEAELESRFPGITVCGLDGEGIRASHAEENRQSELSENLPAAEQLVTTGSAEGLDRINTGTDVRGLIQKVTLAISSALPGKVIVYGILNQVKRKGDRVFLELADTNDRSIYARCVIWGNEQSLVRGLRELGFELEADLQVMFEARVSLNPKGATISLSVDGIIAEYTLSKVQAEREITNQRLKALGVFGRNKTCKMPFLPKRLGVLTSAGGTVIHDFRSSLDESGFEFELLWIPVNVQGDGALRALLDGVRYFSRRSDIDALLIFRGGGSPSELRIFNNFEVCNAVCNCPHPVVSAIGHQEDECSLQDVSFKACGVPKEIGWFFSTLICNYRQCVSSFISEIYRGTRQLVEDGQERLVVQRRFLEQGMIGEVRIRSDAFTRIVQSLPGASLSLTDRGRQYLRSKNVAILELARSLYDRRKGRFSTCLSVSVNMALRNIKGQDQELSQLGRRCLREAQIIGAAVRAKLRAMHSIAYILSSGLDSRSLSLGHIERLLEEVDPRQQLKRGFVIVRDMLGSALIRRASLTANEALQLEFFDGKVVVSTPNEGDGIDE